MLEGEVLTERIGIETRVRGADLEVFVTDLDFDEDIKEDLGSECSKYGRVDHICVDKNSAGFVYLRFDSVQAAVADQRAMHMRWFVQKMISATFMAGPKLLEITS
ncbi:unnamed protein product [Eruca vesicaria subsp. sativa]|uniref:RRM domain-containing protein n=1 Tax=Eruca vesicaria subsp. sativa TaxID=29727 RepID=A0ABC8M4S7_ERUVS|nr:unnamed protein product [Eruca vesicaria subsp. sativa]